MKRVRKKVKIKKLFLLLFFTPSILYSMESRDRIDFFSKNYTPIELQKYILQLGIQNIFKRSENFGEIVPEVSCLLKNVLPINKDIRLLKNELIQYFFEETGKHFDCDINAYNNIDQTEIDKKLEEALVNEPNKENLIQAIQAILAGANPNHIFLNENKLERSVLGWAVLYPSVELTLLLLLKGAHINFQNRFGYTPLMQAVSKAAHNEDAEKIVKVLLDFGADVGLNATDKETALDKAIKTGNISIIKMLEKAAIESKEKAN